MAEHLSTLTASSREEQYQHLLPQLKALIEGESDAIANYANIVAALKQTFGFFWVGFYFAKGEELVLGPFQGTIACTRIKYGKGVCGTAWKENRTIIVPDVELFEGHIACDSTSRSEIVVPIRRNSKVVAILDIDSEHLAHFDEIDGGYLEILACIIEANLDKYSV